MAIREILGNAIWSPTSRTEESLANVLSGQSGASAYNEVMISQKYLIPLAGKVVLMNGFGVDGEKLAKANRFVGILDGSGTIDMNESPIIGIRPLIPVSWSADEDRAGKLGDDAEAIRDALARRYDANVMLWRQPAKVGTGGREFENPSSKKHSP